MDFAGQLKRIRTQRGLSQAKLAQLCDTKVTNISRYEVGSVKPNIEMAVKIARALEVSLDNLCGLTKDDCPLAGLAQSACKLPKEKIIAIEQVLRTFLK